MKRLDQLIFSTVVLALGLSTPAMANLSSSAISSMKVKVYGMYTSSDPTCQTGLVATIPLTSTPQTFDLTKGPTMGTGSVSKPINCFIIVMANSVVSTWKSGTYTTTTTSGGSTYSDSACDAGGTQDQNICKGESPSWPSQITTDASSVGLTLTTSCTGTDSEVIPTYMSTDSACTGQSSLDAGNTTCMTDGGTGPDGFVPPSSSGSADGIKLTSISSVGSKVYFAVNPDQTVGADHDGCTNISPPTSSVHQ